MIVVLLQMQTGQVQFAFEPPNPQMACEMMEMAVKEIKLKMQEVKPSPVVTPPRVPNIRETIFPKLPPPEGSPHG